jgi:hypothetical protein
MPAPPLTHHEILGLVEPFARRGRQVDLAASDRAARRIAFRPIAHTDPPLREDLQLDSLGTGSFKLTRTLTHPGGARATLLGSGDDPAVLLARFEHVPLQRHFDDVPLPQHVDTGAGPVIARSYQFETFAGRNAGDPATARVILRRGEAQLDGLHLAFDIPLVRGVAAEITLTPAPGDALALPQDLLAVIGWDWARLIRKKDLWTSRHRLRGDGQRRTDGAERALRVAAAHLQAVLAAPPAAFHQRFALARWGVVLRRAIPTLTALGMIGGVLILPRLAPNQDPGVFLALHYAPIALLAVAFGLQELPQFEFPPLPRPLRDARWRQGQPAAAR